MPAPLEGIRVVELASFVAAPAAGALLADLGAEVIKVEVPWGEIYRHSLPRFAGYDSDFGLAPHFHMDNRGKRSGRARPGIAAGGDGAPAHRRARGRAAHQHAPRAAREGRARSGDAARRSGRS
jgi:hypothetical protein